MKVLFDYYRQPKAYSDSYGLCLIELEETETVQDVIDKYVTPKRDWYEERYTNPRFTDLHIEQTYWGKKVYTGRLVLLDTHRVYLD